MVKINDKILLDVIGLNTCFFTGDEVIPAVNDVSLTINKGEIFGLVGESGSGKTVTSHSIMGLVHPPGRVVSGKIIFEGTDLLTLSRKQMENVRGNRIGMVFQEPMTALNPVLRIGEQVSILRKGRSNYFGRLGSMSPGRGISNIHTSFQAVKGRGSLWR
jgi:ABC-type dipeptide/oligopeptide/nickel transport system ATPase component